MASLLTPKRECQCCAESNGVCHGEVVVVTTSQSVEVFVRCGPTIEDGTPREQAARFYECLPRLLERAGAKMSDVVLERVFFRNIEQDFATFQEVRHNAYQEAGVTGEELPGASYINQPPCVASQAFEMQVQAVLPNGDSKVIVESFPEIAPHTAKKIVHIGPHRHLYITNINGARPDGSIPSDFREQSDIMFERAVPELTAHGTTFPHVLRTWCYLNDIDRDYDEFNLSRNAFFARHNVQRLPASTGIHGANRLASNSLLEGLVFGERTVRDLNRYLEEVGPTVRKIKLDLDEEPRRGNDPEVVAAGRRRLGEAMAAGCGIVREGERLEQTQTVIREIRDSLRAPAYGVDELELFNLLTVAEHMVASALMREESRGVTHQTDGSIVGVESDEQRLEIGVVEQVDHDALTSGNDEPLKLLLASTSLGEGQGHGELPQAHALVSCPLQLGGRAPVLLVEALGIHHGGAASGGRHGDVIPSVLERPIGLVELVQEVAGGALAAPPQALLGGRRQHEQDRSGFPGFWARRQLDSVGRRARAAGPRWFGSQ
mgnify:CR=1 FL=1